MSVSANPGSTIGDWTASRLIKFIKQMFETDPPSFFPRANIQDLTVTGVLSVEDQITFIRDPNFHNISGTGEPAFTNSWVNFSVANNPAGYWKDTTGYVHLRGFISGGTVGNPAFTLPVGFRPSFKENFGVVSNSAFGYVTVATNGQVSPVSPSSNTSVSLDGINFKAK